MVHSLKRISICFLIFLFSTSCLVDVEENIKVRTLDIKSLVIKKYFTKVINNLIAKLLIKGLIPSIIRDNISILVYLDIEEVIAIYLYNK